MLSTAVCCPKSVAVLITFFSKCADLCAAFVFCLVLKIQRVQKRKKAAFVYYFSAVIVIFLLESSAVLVLFYTAIKC